MNWKCVSELPADEMWHVSCSQRKVDTSQFNKVGCVGCDCCGSNLFWDSGKCKVCASSAQRLFGLIALGVVACIVLLAVVGLMLKYELSLITKHLAPLACFLNFYKSSFSNFALGNQWDSNVQITASWMDSLIFLQSEGALFNPRCFDKSFSVIRLKIIVLSAAPVVIIIFLCLIYYFFKMKKKNRITDNMTAGVSSVAQSSDNPLSSRLSAEIRSSEMIGNALPNDKVMRMIYICTFISLFTKLLIVLDKYALLRAIKG